MNMLTTPGKLNRTLLAGFAVAALAMPLHSSADELQPVYTMTVIEDASSGGRVLAGKYELAIQRIRKRGDRRRFAFESSTNLCVAYTKSGDFENAETACEAAVDFMRAKLESGNRRRDFPPGEALGARNYLAVALSNRGVFHAVNGEPEQARKDFSEAVGLRAKLSAAKTNLARIRRAQTESPDS